MIWRRYLIKEMLKFFSLFVMSFFFLYVLIDYTIHLQTMTKNTSHFNLLIYYMMVFSKRASLLLPLAVLMTTLKVLCSCNRNHELLAFQVAALSIKRLLTPFFLLALICTSFNYINLQFLIPLSRSYIDVFEKTLFKKKKHPNTPAVRILALQDGSNLIYQYFDPMKREFFDLFWVISTDLIWHIKTLSLQEHLPLCSHVDIIQRNDEGLMEKKTSYLSCSFPIAFNDTLEMQIKQLPENCAISELWKKYHQGTDIKNQATIQVHFYFKLLIPWLSFLVIIIAAPYCFEFNRKLPVFFIFAGAIIGYIALFTLLNAFLILGEASVIPPVFAIFTLPILLFGYFGLKFIKIG